MNADDPTSPEQIRGRLKQLQRDGLYRWHDSEVEIYHSTITGDTLIVLTFDAFHVALTAAEAAQICEALSQIPGHPGEGMDASGKEVVQ